jgi:hypothetical protein
MSDNDKGSKSASEDEREQSGEDLSHSGEEDHPDVKWDPSKKPKKSILKKEGEHHEKKEGHIALNADEVAEHDAEKKTTNKNLPIEGVQGIVKKGEGKKAIIKKGDNKEHQMLRPRNKDGTPGAQSQPTPKNHDDTDKKEEAPGASKSHLEPTEADLATMDEKEKEKCIIS